MALVEINSPTSVDPDMAVINRIDQIVQWKLNAPNLAWNPKFPNHAIRFHLLAKPPFTTWPGRPPHPVGPAPAPGTPDRRDYEADCGSPMPNGKFEFYSYDIAVIDTTTGEEFNIRVRRSDEQMAARGPEFAKLVHARRHGHGAGALEDWYDPDIENRPQP